jgi:protein-tyrosine phosphatase
MKQFIVQQSIQVAMSYVIKAETLKDALEMGHEAYDRSQVIDIQILDWDYPWDVSEAEELVKPVLEETLKYWDNVL